MVIKVCWAVWVALSERMLRLYLPSACGGWKLERMEEAVPQSSFPAAQGFQWTSRYIHQHHSVSLQPLSYPALWLLLPLFFLVGLLLYLKRAKSKRLLLWPGASKHCCSTMCRRYILFRVCCLSHKAEGRGEWAQGPHCAHVPLHAPEWADTYEDFWLVHGVDVTALPPF